MKCKTTVIIYLFVSVNRMLKSGLEIVAKLQNPDQNVNNDSYFPPLRSSCVGSFTELPAGTMPLERTLPRF
jgi:hypothetical protein